MGVWGAIVLIVLIGCITELLRVRYKAHRAVAERASEEAALSRKHAWGIEQEVIEIKKRIAVLERIATDDPSRLGLADEIESLRDRR